MNYYILRTWNDIKVNELYAARGLINRLFGSQFTAWHNHHEEHGASVHQYPAIQYKILNGKLAIVALEKCLPSLFEFARSMPLEGMLQAKDMPRRRIRLEWMSIDKYSLSPGFLDQPKVLQCSNWIPMDSSAYQAFRALCEDKHLNPNASVSMSQELISMFSALLAEQIDLHAASIGLIPKGAQSQTRIIDSTLEYTQTRVYGIKKGILKNFRFETDLDWGPELGIGHGVAIAYGTSREVHFQDTIQ